MGNLTLFEALFVTHLIMDWIFQWEWEAINKPKKWLPLFFHCTINTIGKTGGNLNNMGGYEWRKENVQTPRKGWNCKG